MKKPELVIMAAGMGSRYGGLKQIDVVDEYGHIMIDYSIYDAIRAGFSTITFIIKKSIEADFRAVMDKHLAGKPVEVKYVFQELDKLPDGFTVPEDRVKPWGTAHALMCCRGVVDAPFAVINADDYYGVNAFKRIYEFLSSVPKEDDKYHYAMVGYYLKNTVTENGTVARGVCKCVNGMLSEVVERTSIGVSGDTIYYSDGDDEYVLDPDSIVSMNLWGLTPSYLEECYQRFSLFLDENLEKNPLKCEYYLPTVVSELLAEGKADVKVLDNTDKWYGVTYREDKDDVVEAFGQLTESGVYPKNF